MSRAPEEAVRRLKAFLESNLAAALRAVETEEGISASSLADPVAFLDYEAPHDNRAPLIAVFDESGGPIEPAGQRHNLWAVGCTVAISTGSADADIQSNSQFARRYVGAVVKCIRDAPTLGSTVVAAIVGRWERETFGDESAVRFVYFLDVEIHVHTP